MLAKTVQVEVVKNTFPNSTVPPSLMCPSTVSIDVADALLMLGQLTSPSGFTTASPARYWAWLRYLSAIASTPDLRISGPFIDLDPHQKTILSDDLGVALTTTWLHNCLGGFSEIVDGRKFLLQFGTLVRRRRRTTPKVGIGKCPDYVVRDYGNRWHVIECKGTQSSRAFRNRQLSSARLQKQVIEIRGSLRGERLAAGIYLGNERESHYSHLRVIDPEPQPLLTLDERQSEKASAVMERLAVSRAMALAGFDELAAEIDLPTERFEEFETLYTSEERRRLSQPREPRLTSAFRALPRTRVNRFEMEGAEYVGQRVEVRIPGDDFRKNTGCTTVRISQGINSALIDNAMSITADYADNLIEQSTPFLADPSIRFSTDGLTTTLFESRLSATRMEFLN